MASDFSDIRQGNRKIDRATRHSIVSLERYLNKAVRVLCRSSRYGDSTGAWCLRSVFLKAMGWGFPQKFPVVNSLTMVDSNSNKHSLQEYKRDSRRMLLFKLSAR